MARAVYKHVGSFRKANRISTLGSQAQPRTGGAKEGRGAEFSRAVKLESMGGVWPNKASGGWGTNSPTERVSRKQRLDLRSDRDRDGAEMSCQEGGPPTSPSVTCVIFS